MILLLNILELINGEGFECDKVQNFRVGYENKTLNGCKFISRTIEDPNWDILTHDVCIEGLFMSNNKGIKYLPDSVANSLPNIVFYDASDCSIEEIWASNFDGLSKLKQLLLSKNSLEFIPSYAFQGLTELEELDLGENLF